MTKLIATAITEENLGLAAQIDLSVDEAFEWLRINFADEVPMGDHVAIEDALDKQGIFYDMVEHDVDLSDVRAELPDAKQVYKDVYNVLDSHAYGEAAGVGYCVCRGWDSASLAHNYNDHVTMAVLTALGLPIAGPTA